MERVCESRKARLAYHEGKSDASFSRKGGATVEHTNSVRIRNKEQTVGQI